MKNTELVRNFAIGGVCILVAAMALLGVETNGRALASRAGIFGLVIIVALLAIAAISANKIEAEAEEKTISAAKKAAAKKHE